MRKVIFIFLLFSAFAHGQIVDRFTRFEAECVDPSNQSNPNPEIITGDVRAYCENEANVTPDWLGFGPVAVTYSNEAVPTIHGEYAAYMEATGTSFGRTRNRFTTVSGQVYEYTFTYLKTQGDQGRFQFAVGATGTSLTGLAATTLTTLTGEFTATATTVEIDTWCQTSTGGAIGDDMFYKLSIKLKDD